jgi:hypothetical protein
METKNYIYQHKSLPIYFTIIASSQKEAKDILKQFGIRIKEVRFLEKIPH